MIRKEEIELEYQPYIDYLPITPNKLFEKATESDEITIKSWRPTWVNNVKENHKKYGPFCDRSIGKFYNANHRKPAIIIGSGPSLKHNIQDLKLKKGITTISCLHNFHFLEDNDVPADFYITLDAGDVTIEEVYEGGNNSPEFYWDKTKDRTLIAYIGTSPKLLEKWQGEIYFFNAPVPEMEFMRELDDVEIFNVYISNGGNVLGACLYFAKSFLGSPIVAFLGADFSFSYQKKFHPWNSKYDSKLGHTLKVKDIFGNSVHTWQSYHNFKGWFEYVALSIPGIYFNCSEGGTFGAYPDGNIRSPIQMPLKEFIKMMNLNEEIEAQSINPKIEERKLLF